MGGSSSRVQRYLLSIGKKQNSRQNYERVARLSLQTSRATFIKKVVHLLLIVISLSSGTSQLYAKEQKIKIHNESVNFIDDIEARTSQLKIDNGCDNKWDTCLPGFDVFDGTDTYIFFYRRPQTMKQGREDEKEFLKMLKSAKTFRIVGTGAKVVTQEPIPKSFLKNKLNDKKLFKTTSLAFERLQVGNKCKSYFKDTYDLPKNYWAGTIPPKNK